MDTRRQFSDADPLPQRVEGAEQYRAMFELAGIGIAQVDPATGRFLRVNPKMCEIAGYSERELLVASTHPDDRDRSLADLRRMVCGEVPRYPVEKWYSRRDGSMVWLRIDARVTRGEAGEPRMVVATVQDITPHRQAEEALRLSEERFRGIVEQSPLSIQVLSPDGRTLQVNRAWEKLWGVTLEDIAGYNLLEDPQLVAKGIMPYILKGFAGEPTQIPPVMYDPDETIPGLSGNEEPRRWTRAFVYPVKDETGTVREVILVHEDITERKRIEDALTRSEERHRAVVEQTAEGIYLIDAETGRILESNAALERMLGYTSEELLGMRVYDLIAHDPGSVEDNVRRTVAKRQHFVGERRYRRKDGKLVDVEVNASMISYGNRQVLCAVVRDITLRKKAEQATAEIREAERRRIARDLHDVVLQDMVAALQAMQAAQLEERAGSDAGLSEAVGALREAVQSLRDAVYDLRPERERPLVRLVESMVEFTRQMLPGCRVKLVVEDELPSGVTEETKVELVRIIQEALSNARRHSNARVIEVTLGCDDGSIRAEVADDGAGFTPGITSEGVGLSTMRERALAAGGELEVYSEIGVGTRVAVRVPSRASHTGPPDRRGPRDPHG